MKARGFLGNVRFWKWSFVILTMVAFLLGSAYFNIDDAYMVHIDVNGQVEKSSVLTKSKSNADEPPKLKPPHKLELLSAKNIYFLTDGHMHEIHGSSGRMVKQYNKKLHEAYTAKPSTDITSDRVSRHNNGNKIDHTNLQEKNKERAEVVNNRVTERNSMTANQMSLSSRSSMKILKRPTSFTKRRKKDYLGRTRQNMASKYKHMPQRYLPRPMMAFDLPVRQNSAYVIQDLESLRINKTDTSTLVLLVTYARSGSSWLGAITSQAKDTFYVFEPLQRFIVQGYLKKDLVCYNDNTCRKPRLTSETHNFAISTIHRLFTCQFTKLHPRAVQVFARNVKNGNFKKCMKVSFSVMKCLQELEGICMASTHRVLKTIRISMELVEIMMGLWPNLKIVHLVRDPRGITNSRIKRQTFAMAKNIVSHSHNMCERMFDDLEYNSVLEKKYENRIKLVFYEALAERPLDGVQFIYTFLDMNLTQNIATWLYDSTHAQTKSGYYGTKRSDAVENAYHWQAQLTMNKIKIIDNICKDIYQLLGFIPMDTEARFQNITVSSRRSVTHSNWFS